MKTIKDRIEKCVDSLCWYIPNGHYRKRSDTDVYVERVGLALLAGNTFKIRLKNDKVYYAWFIKRNVSCTTGEKWSTAGLSYSIMQRRYILLFVSASHKDLKELFVKSSEIIEFEPITHETWNEVYNLFK